MSCTKAGGRLLQKYPQFWRGSKFLTKAKEVFTHGDTYPWKDQKRAIRALSND